MVIVTQTLENRSYSLKVLEYYYSKILSKYLITIRVDRNLNTIYEFAMISIGRAIEILSIAPPIKINANSVQISYIVFIFTKYEKMKEK